MRRRKNENNEVRAAKINARATIIAEIIAAIACVSSIYLGSALESNKEQSQELQNQLAQANQTIEELENKLNSIENSDNEEAYNEKTNLSSQEIVKQSFDLIQQLKSEYSIADTVTVMYDKVIFQINEKAGYIYQNLTKKGKFIVLSGDSLPSSKMIILDYSNDDIIYDFSSQQDGEVIFSPGNDNKFYCVVFHDNYDIYVSPPIQVVGGEYCERIEICLEREDFEYTPLFQFRLYVQDLGTDEEYSIASGADDHEYWGNFEIVNKYSNESSSARSWKMSDTGMIEWNGYAFFSLNTNYVMDISLSRNNDFSCKSTHYTFDGSIEGSNLIDIYLEFSDENDI